MVSAVAAVAQQHVVGVAFAPADAAASVEDGARPEDGALQAGQVHKHLQHTHTHTRFRRKLPIADSSIRRGRRWAGLPTWESEEQESSDSLQRSSTVLLTRPPSLPSSGGGRVLDSV